MKGLLHLCRLKLRSLCQHFFISCLLCLPSILFTRCYYPKRRLRLFGCGLFAVLAVVFSLLGSSSASALTGIGPMNVEHITPSSFTMRYKSTSTNCTGKQGDKVYCQVSLPAGYYSLDGFIIPIGKKLTGGTYISFSISLEFANAPSEYNFFGFNASGEFAIVDQEIIWNSGNKIATFNIVVYASQEASEIRLSSKDNSGFYANGNLSGASNLVVRLGPLQVIRVIGGLTFDQHITSIDNSLKDLLNKGIPVKVDNSSVVSAINSGNTQAHTDAQNQLNATNANTTAVNNASSQAHKDSQAQVDATNKQTEQEKNQYEQDKQEEQDRENKGKDDANKLGGMFSFNVLNPFIGIFDMFSSSSCVDIPIISGWVHSESSTYCSWFPSSVRNVLTPVFSLASSMLLFGFIVRWLDGGNFAGGIEV